MERGKARQGADPIVNQETNMSIRLFAAINDCSRMVVDGYEIDEYGIKSDNGTTVYRVSCDDDPMFEFADQDIEINMTGEAEATDLEGNSCQLTFYTERVMTESDFD